MRAGGGRKDGGRTGVAVDDEIATRRVLGVWRVRLGGERFKGTSTWLGGSFGRLKLRSLPLAMEFPFCLWSSLRKFLFSLVGLYVQLPAMGKGQSGTGREERWTCLVKQRLDRALAQICRGCRWTPIK